MFKNNLEKITGIGIYPMISLLVFFIFFILMFVWLMKSDKNRLEELSKMPLINNDQDNN